MRLLLDTHALLWWLADDRRLSDATAELFDAPGNETLVSVVSLWEIAIKVRSGKLEADVEEVQAGMVESGFVALSIKLPHLVQLRGLPRHHGDPFDHLLIAQAIAEDAVFVTQDRAASRYAVRILPCR